MSLAPPYRRCEHEAKCFVTCPSCEDVGLDQLRRNLRMAEDAEREAKISAIVATTPAGENPTHETLGRALCAIVGSTYAEAVVEDGVFSVISDDAPIMAWELRQRPDRDLLSCLSFLRASLPSDAVIDLRLAEGSCVASVRCAPGQLGLVVSRRDERVCLALLTSALRGLGR